MDSPAWIQDQFGLMFQFTQLKPAFFRSLLKYHFFREVITLSKVVHCSLLALYSFTLSYFSSEQSKKTYHYLTFFTYYICLFSPFSNNNLHEDSFIPHYISSAK